MAASFACRQQGNPYQCEALECQSAMKLLMVNGPNYLRQSPPRGATIANAAYYRHTTPENAMPRPKEASYTTFLLALETGIATRYSGNCRAGLAESGAGRKLAQSAREE